MQKYRKFSKPPNVLVKTCDFFSKKRKRGVCTLQFCARFGGGGTPQKKAQTDTHGKIKIYLFQMNIKQKYIVFISW